MRSSISMHAGLRLLLTAVLLAVGMDLCACGAQLDAFAAVTPQTTEEGLAQQAAVLLSSETELPPVISTSATEGDLLVCLDIPTDSLAGDGWRAMEEIQTAIRRLLTPLSWHSLSVQAWDASVEQCRPLSDYAPDETFSAATLAEIDRVQREVAVPAVGAQSTAGSDYPASLSGKTVYISAGHGWYWNGRQWRTQRPPYQGIIEDHNNAEAVTQYLIPYLENAGATVVSMRERDWSSTSTIADNDGGAPQFSKSGAWFTGGSGPGYGGGTYQYAISTSGEPNAEVTWTLDVAASDEYAIYAWIFPGNNRVADARYTIHHAGGEAQVLLDQRIFPNTWRYLGTFPFYAGTAKVTLDNHTESGGAYAVIADAIRLGGGAFTSLDAVATATTLPVSSQNPTPLPAGAPRKPWWETSTFFYSQAGGLDPYPWGYFNDVVARPIFARWHQRRNPGDAIYVTWHTNGYNGNNTTVRGTVSYVHNGDTHPRTPGSKELQSAIHNELVHDIRAGWDSAWNDRGTGALNLGELRMLWDADVAAARIPGVLLEIAYHDNYEDALALKDPEFNRLASRAVYQGIVAYFENKDNRDLVLAPEPPTHLQVQNAGGGEAVVSWLPSPTDSEGLLGETALGYHVYTSSDGFAWGTPQLVSGTELRLTGFSAGETFYVKVTGINTGGESLPSEVLGARIGDAGLLIVSAFDKLNRFGLVYENDPIERENLRMWVDQMNSFDYVTDHGGAVPDDVTWDSASNEAVIAGTVNLADYAMVDWILGEETTTVDGTLNATERGLLEDYLRLGRGLMISGSELGWELVEQNSAPAFLSDVLHTGYVNDDAGTYTVRPDSEGTFAGLGDLSFDAPGEYLVDFPDVLAPRPPARTSMAYVGGDWHGESAVVEYAAGCERLLVFGYPFETLRPNQRVAVMERSLDFLNACAPLDTSIVVPEDGSGYQVLPASSGTATGADLTAVRWQLIRSGDDAGDYAVAADDLYWTGAGWDATETWLTAEGTHTWSRSLPSLDEAAYRIRAYSVGAAGIDDTPAEASFLIDRTAPLTPTVITPTGGITITTPGVVLDWESLTDAGTPVHFEVAVGEVTLQAPAAPYRLPLSIFPGVHRWRVRAVDSAGNVSAWTDWAAFYLDVEWLVLPLVMRDAGAKSPPDRCLGR